MTGCWVGQVYAVLREDWTSGAGHTVCASQSASAGLVYTSKSNVIEARLVTHKSHQAPQFFLKVERNTSSYHIALSVYTHK